VFTQSRHAKLMVGTGGGGSIGGAEMGGGGGDGGSLFPCAWTMVMGLIDGEHKKTTRRTKMRIALKRMILLEEEGHSLEDIIC